MTDQERAQLAIELGLIRSVLGTLITWIAQSSTGVILVDDAEELLKKLDYSNTNLNNKGKETKP